MTAVTIDDGFWKPKLEINRTVTIPHILKENDDTGRVANFEKAAGKKSGAYEGRRFNDTDIYKIIEAASYSLALVPDPRLSTKLDELIQLIAESQEKDGYLFPARTIDPKNPAPGVGPERWIYENGSHELYNAGHLYEAAVAHFEATGKRTLLDVAIKNADLWNQRMFLLHGDGKYIDLFERVLYNGVLAGVSLAGNTFFYQNPLESNGRANRTPYFEVACCPANLARMLEQLPGLVYAQTNDPSTELRAGPSTELRAGTIYANLYVGNHATVKLGSRTVKIAQDTRYPWDGDVALTLDPEGRGAFTIALRIPGWSRDQPVPSDLYRYADGASEPPSISVRSGNASPVPVALDIRDGYVRIKRNWKRGDTIHLTLPMPARRIVAHAWVKDDDGKMAIQRGPLVFAFEAVDNGDHALDLVIQRAVPLRSRFRADLLDGVEVITGDGNRPFVAVPYYAWNNRGQGEMAVWIKEKP